jgi:hypothetical protein
LPANSSDLLLPSISRRPLIAAERRNLLQRGMGIAYERDLIVAETGARFRLVRAAPKPQ